MTGSDGPTTPSAAVEHRLPLRWLASPAAKRTITVGVVAGIAALTLGRPDLLLLAAVPFGLLIGAAGRSRLPDEVRLEAAIDPASCTEQDRLALTAVAVVPGRVGQIDLGVGGRGAGVLDGAAVTERWVARAEIAASLAARRWGRWTSATIRVRITDESGGRRAETTCNGPEIRIYPRPLPVGRGLVPRELPARLGNHSGRVAGSGVEFAGIRPYQPGDRLRDVNWPVSTRLGRWHITQRAAERSADVVVGIDAFSDVGGTLDRAVHGAASVALSALAAGDRAGVVVFGGGLRWLRPQVGQIARYRILEMVLALRRDSSVVTPDIDRVPRTALPPGAVVVAFTPLLDPRVIALVSDLARRRVQTVVVDVLNDEPREIDHRGRLRRGPDVDRAMRLWRLDRAALLDRLAEQGMIVLRWDGVRSLAEVLEAISGRRMSGVPATPGAAGPER